MSLVTHRESEKPMKTDRAVYQNLRNAIELFYDNQRARISYEHRADDPNKTEKLGDDDKAFMDKMAAESSAFEKDVLKYASKKMKDHPIYEWLIDQRGIAATFAIILMGYIDIEKTETASGLWRLCGLAVIGGKAEKPKKGEKLAYNPHLKSRCYLLGESFLKANNTHWRAYYDDYKSRKQKEIVTCMLCKGEGVYTASEAAEKKFSKGKTLAEVFAEPGEPYSHDIPPNLPSDWPYGKAMVDANTPLPKKEAKPKKCPRCNGAKVAPWGNSDKHVHIAAMRYMVKQFLVVLYAKWREYEGLSVRVPYAEEYHERMKLVSGGAR